jgi:hypothetical protein
MERKERKMIVILRMKMKRKMIVILRMKMERKMIVILGMKMERKMIVILRMKMETVETIEIIIGGRSIPARLHMLPLQLL